MVKVNHNSVTYEVEDEVTRHNELKKLEIAYAIKCHQHEMQLLHWEHFNTNK